MRVAVYLPLVWSVLLPLLAPRVVAAVAPRWSAPILAGTGLLTALSWLWSCTVLLALAMAGLEPLAAMAGLTAQHPHLLPRPGVALVAAGFLAVTVSAVTRLVIQHHRDRHGVRRLDDGAGTDAQVLVLADLRPQAYAIGGWPTRGRIVTTTGLLDALDAPGRTVVLAHEQAHLRRGHHLLGAMASLSAALDPFLISLPAHVGFACERDADEVAAQRVADRSLVARTIAHAALLAATPPSPHAGLDFARDAVPRRVQALLAPAVRTHLPLAVATLALLAATSCSTLDVAHDAQRVMDLLRRR